MDLCLHKLIFIDSQRTLSSFLFCTKKKLFMCSITIYCYVVVHNEDGGLCINVCLVA